MSDSERAFLFTASTHLSVWLGKHWPSRREPPSGTYFGSFRLLTALEITGFVLARAAQVPIHAVLACVVTTEPGIALFEGCAYQLVPHSRARVSRRIAFVPLFGVSISAGVVASDLFERHFPRELGHRAHSGVTQFLPRSPWPPD